MHSVTDGQMDGQTDVRTDRQTTLWCQKAIKLRCMYKAWPRWYQRTVESVAACRQWREDDADQKMSIAVATCRVVYLHPHQLLRLRCLLCPFPVCHCPRRRSYGRTSMLRQSINQSISHEALSSIATSRLNCYITTKQLDSLRWTDQMLRFGYDCWHIHRIT